ncbi:nuclear transport factor 2 family protein [Aquabacterium sp.]|uniref:nuclear transport factor 2 family protein n=1 Tax=Aquabacterium sp. TaxID=1872578 RepID=UPI003782E7B5
MFTDAQALADRYVAAWNETDDPARRRAIAELWALDGEHYVNARAVRGHAQLEERVAGSHHKNVRDAGHRFRAVQDARALRDIVTFHWQMFAPASSEVLATGLEVLRLNADGLIAVDYQFIVG